MGGKGPGQLHTGLPCWRECTRHASKQAGGRQAGRLSSHQHRCDVALRPAVLLQVPGIVQLVAADLQGAQQHRFRVQVQPQGGLAPNKNAPVSTMQWDAGTTTAHQMLAPTLTT